MTDNNINIDEIIDKSRDELEFKFPGITYRTVVKTEDADTFRQIITNNGGTEIETTDFGDTIGFEFMTEEVKQ
jgi:hypothetical protein